MSLFHELHVLLTFILIVNDKFRPDWKFDVEIVKSDKRRLLVQYKRKGMKIKRNVQEDDFRLPVTTLSNLFGQYFGVDLVELCNYKRKLLKADLSSFNGSFNDIDKCSWQLKCNYADCRNIKKLELK